mgnify:CR=1 FL=1
MSRVIATLPWSFNLLPEPKLDLSTDISVDPQLTWLAPLVRAAPDDQPWLIGANGNVLRGGDSWQRVNIPGGLIQGLAPQTGGGAVLLTGPEGGPWSLAGIDSHNQTQWRIEAPELEGRGARLALLQDEQGRPYFFRPDRGGLVHRVDPTNGELTIVADLPDYNASILVWEEAIWRIQYIERRRRWVRRAFGGTDQEISAADSLQDTLLTAIGVRPGGAPLLTDGARLISMAPSGVPTEIPLPLVTGHHVLDLLRACPRPNGEVWVVVVDTHGTRIYALFG